ncbi:SDR family NAD(P)-dependent oxidoreductase [Streptomyces sp. NPDC059193]|uniref:SDR family NAD(P)-dependent oxidoreductase n=1 Tax=Streptomyces sp. NPDC059193 TaxID=3346763 RepID=UPI0036CF41FC
MTGPATRPRALVTGASEGIGYAIARELAAAGYAVTGAARGEERLRAVIDALGPGHSALVADLATEDGRKRVVQAVQRTPFDVLVNNAGTATEGPFADVPLDSAAAMLDLNCHAVVTLAHAFLAGARPGDALVNVSSTLAFAPMPHLSVYSATKAFVTSFSESLWHEQKARGVYVMGFCPGMTATRSQPHQNNDVPAGLVQTPEQVAAAALSALRRRAQPTVISGTKNALFAAAARTLPRRMVLRLLAAEPKAPVSGDTSR